MRTEHKRRHCIISRKPHVVFCSARHLVDWLGNTYAASAVFPSRLFLILSLAGVVTNRMDGSPASAECVRVVVRCRPLNSTETSQGRRRIANVDAELQQV